MYETTYHRATSVADAASKLAGAEEAKILSGGQTLLPTMKQRLAAPSDLVDVAHVAQMKGIAETGGALRIGAATTHAEVAGSDIVRRLAPGLADLAGHIGDPHVRHRGTIGGSLANNDPAADYPAAALALGATIVTDRREIAAADFFTGLFETALEDGEMVVSISFAPALMPSRSCFVRSPTPLISTPRIASAIVGPAMSGHLPAGLRRLLIGVPVVAELGPALRDPSVEVLVIAFRPKNVVDGELGGLLLGLDEALEVASRIPGALTGSIEVRPVMEMCGG